MPISGTKKTMPTIVPRLYIIGANEVTRNFLNTISTAEIILLMPKIIGLKNIMRVSMTVASFLSAVKPGAITPTKLGAHIHNTPHTIIKKILATVSRLERYLKALSESWVKFWVKIGIMATLMAPIIKTKATKSGIRKAA